MCGIFGKISIKPITNIQQCIESLHKLFHRGPDDFGIWTSENKNIFFGHRRLSIIDLTINGNQPMNDNTNRFVIVFNGEIYNFLELKKSLISKGHLFKTDSDTEVILNSYKEWGITCPNHFNGMFSIAIYDKLKNEIFLARDRAGEKPLFISLNNKNFYFSSEIKAIINDIEFDRAINRIALDCYFSFGTTPGELSIFKNIAKLQPGCALLFDVNSFSDPIIWKYWNLPELNINHSQDIVTLTNDLENLLQDSVSKQMHADVPVGILLSGGIDSSLVTAMATRMSDNVKTFTITFPGYGKFDESQYAEIVSKYFRTKHTKLSASDVSIVDFLNMTSEIDEPMADSSSIPTFLVSKLIKQYCKVALGGDGGDELFGGYPFYSRVLNLKYSLDFFPEIFRYLLSKSATNFLPTGFKGRNWGQELFFDLENELPLTSSFFNKNDRRKLINENASWLYVAEIIQRRNIPINQDIIQRATRYDFSNYLCNDILHKVDRASMLNSLEIRAPFLDYRIIEFAFSQVPSTLKATKNDKKILLKNLCKKILPKELDFNRKQGFSIPLSHWLNNDSNWTSFFREVLLDSPNTFLNKNYIESLFKGHLNGRNNAERIYSLVVFERWCNVNNINTI
jgi:asparagine synthase (glutamine-hydrolysing)